MSLLPSTSGLSSVGEQLPPPRILSTVRGCEFHVVIVGHKPE